MNMNSSAHTVTSPGNSAEAPPRFISQSQSKDMQGRNEKFFTLMNLYIKFIIKIFGIWRGVSNFNGLDQSLLILYLRTSKG